MHKSPKTAVVLFLFSCMPALAAPIDPGGVAGLILFIVFLVPLLILIASGWAIGRTRGAAIGLAIYLAGLGYLKMTAHREEEARLSKFHAEKQSWNQACMHDAGEFGQPITYLIKKVFVYLDPSLTKYGFLSRYSVARTSEPIEFVSSKPEKLNDGEVLVDVHVIDRPNGTANGIRLQGVETNVFDSAGKSLAKRVNFFAFSTNCFQESEDRGIERFLRKILRVEKAVFNAFPEGALVIPKEYLVASLAEIETGNYVAMNDVSALVIKNES